MKIAIPSILASQAATISITTGDGLGADTHIRSDLSTNLVNNYGSSTSTLLGSNAGDSPDGLISEGFTLNPTETRHLFHCDSHRLPLQNDSFTPENRRKPVHF